MDEWYEFVTYFLKFQYFIILYELFRASGICFAPSYIISVLYSKMFFVHY